MQIATSTKPDAVKTSADILDFTPNTNRKDVKLNNHEDKAAAPSSKNEIECLEQPSPANASTPQTMNQVNTPSSLSNTQTPPASQSPPQPTSLAKLQRKFPEDLQPWPNPVDINTTANLVADEIRKHCVMTDHEVDAIVLWLLSSYLINSFRIFPKLALISPEKRCGKTTVMETVDAFCKDGLMVSNLSPAVVYRITQTFQPTLLIDEGDTFLKDGDPQLVGIINSSHNQRSATVIRCSGDDHSPTTFSTWMPIVLASIGALPPTIMDRSIVINLRRKKTTEQVNAIPVDYADLMKDLRQQILRWAIDISNQVKVGTITPPDIGNDRARDNWIPLFSVANEMGGNWLSRCDNAYKALTDVPEFELPTQLLLDIREVLSDHSEDRITSEQLVNALNNDAAKIWSTYSSGRNLTQAAMAKMLKPYGVTPKTYRFPGGTKRGFEKKVFNDAFERYLPD